MNNFKSTLKTAWSQFLEALRTAGEPQTALVLVSCRPDHPERRPCYDWEKEGDFQ